MITRRGHEFEINDMRNLELYAEMEKAGVFNNRRDPEQIKFQKVGIPGRRAAHKRERKNRKRGKR